MDTKKTRNNTGFALSADSKILHTGARVLTVLIAVGAFVLSFAALTDLAIAAGIVPQLAWVWAVSVDGFILINTLAAFSLQNKGKANVYAWTILFLFVVLSIFGNAWHAVLATTDFSLPLPVAVIVTAIPPITLFLSIHLLILMVQPTKEQKVELEKEKKRRERLQAIEDREIEKLEKQAIIEKVRGSEAARIVEAQKTERIAKPIKVASTTPVAPVEAPDAVKPPSLVSAGVSAETSLEGVSEPLTSDIRDDGIATEDEVLARLEALLEAGKKLPSGRTVGEWLGKSERTGQNLVKRFKTDRNLV